jgi:peptidylprolyl isomerase
MSEAKRGDNVKVHVAVKLKDGKIYDSTKNKEPLEITIGQGKFIRGLEEAIIGMTPGEKKKLDLPPERAFGPYKEGLTIKVDKKSIPPQIDPKIGMELEMSRGEGEKTRVRITEMNNTTVTVDANHPLAGEKLVFDIELLEIINN